jgi:sRNA-binding regulator protein Hfq
MVLAALHERRPLTFVMLDGEILEGVPTGFATYSIEVESEGERVAIFKNALKMIRRPKLQG